MSPEDLSRLWSTHAAKLAGMQARKGALVPGMDADIVVRGWAAHASDTLAPYFLQSLPCNYPPF